MSEQQLNTFLKGTGNGFALTEAASITIDKMRKFTKLIHRQYNAVDAAEICFGKALSPFVVVTLLELHMKGANS
jgi:hypothetical protein